MVLMNLRTLICRLLAQYGIYPKGCPGKPPAVVIGADKAKISLSQKGTRK